MQNCKPVKNANEFIFDFLKTQNVSKYFWTTLKEKPLFNLFKPLNKLKRKQMRKNENILEIFLFLVFPMQK